MGAAGVSATRRSPHDIYNVVTVFKGGVGYDSMKLREAAKGHVGVN